MKKRKKIKNCRNCFGLLSKLYRDIASWVCSGMEELSCNMVGWKASLAWVKAVSRYKYCIVTEGGLEGLGFVLQYTSVL